MIATFPGFREGSRDPGPGEKAAVGASDAIRSQAGTAPEGPERRYALREPVAAVAAPDRIGFATLSCRGQQESRMTGTEIIPVIDLGPYRRAPLARDRSHS